ncbi:MAG: hypothetical protein ACJ77B_12050 [Chloroflexota bacterium]
MPRRLFALLAVVGLLFVVGCQGVTAPSAAPALTDPKQILTQSVLALKDVKTVQIKGELTGSATVPGSGTIDLKGTTLDVSADIPGKKAHATISAPSILGTSIDVIAVDNAVYTKVLGPLAATMGADASGKYKKTEATAAASDNPADVAADPLKAIDELRKQLDKLPAPTKAADEKCGNVDCYHINLTITDKDLAALSPDASASLSSTPITLTIDVFPQKTDLRPAKLAVTINAGTVGTFTLTLTMTYDQPVTITAPPADQIAP